MALHTVHPGDPSNASDIQQFVDLLTGVMTDQLVTLNGGLALGANAGNTVPVMRGTVALGVRIFVQTGTPSGANEGDLWLQA